MSFGGSVGPDGYFRIKHGYLAYILLSKIFSFVFCSLWPQIVNKWSQMANNRLALVETVILRQNSTM